MKKKILLVSRYVDPYPVGGNKNVFLQAQSLKRDFGINIEILTWPDNDLWTGPVPPIAAQPQIVRVEREGITYHVFRTLDRYDIPQGGAELSENDWENSVQFGMRLLTLLDPDIVHLQHRHGLWWILESAQRLGIASIYSNHDWGIPCMRTVLVMGNKQLCDGLVEPGKCASCIRSGRSTLVGRLNETLVSYPLGEQLCRIAIELPGLGIALKRRGFVMQNAEIRTLMHYHRATRVLMGLSHCFTPSRFGATFFTRLGCPPDRISVLPWYHDPVDLQKKIYNQVFTITYIGRVSPEKGVHLIFSALELLNISDSILVRIAGSNDSAYCSQLMKKYPSTIGPHKIEWLGWSAIEPLFQSTDVTIIPSQVIDNTPLALIESLAYRTPVIATRVPPIEELLVEGETGFMAEYGSVHSLTAAINRAVSSKSLIRNGMIGFPVIPRLNDYMGKVVQVYHSI